MPIPVVQFYLVPGSTGDWKAHRATFGKVPSRSETIFGYKLHLLVTLGGLVLDFELAPANATDLQVGCEMLAEHTDLDVLGDKAYISADKAAQLWKQNRLRLRTIPRRNQKKQSPAYLKKAYNKVRQIIETVNGQLSEQFNIEKNHAHTFFYKPSAAEAAKKAFLVNRVGDFGMALAVMWMFYLFGKTAGSLAFTDVFQAVEGASPAAIAAITGVTLLLLLAATGKSAQLPLFVWLPDAMEGPSPVSALIHAATMVTAGVYMLARSHPLLELAPVTMQAIAWVGALTALMAASIALVQTDLKRILAYSTISQLGYMFLAVGMGAYTAAIFHLVTHAFFKALLFLTAGSVMHATHGQLNIDFMGGLKKKMPTTYWQFLVGSLALAGFPLLAGFWSKDEILLGTFVENQWLYAIGLFTALLTAFYAFRAVYRVFHGSPRKPHLYEHAHEQPFGMTGPLWILVIGALFGGFIGLSNGIGDIFSIEHINQIETWLHPAFEDVEMIEASLRLQIILFLLSGALALLGMGLAYVRYVRQASWTISLQRLFSPLQPVLENKYWVDELYMAVIVNPLRSIARFLYRIGDQGIIEGVVNGVGRLTTSVGQGVAHIETGHLSWYALSLFIGAVALVGYFLLVG